MDINQLNKAYAEQYFKDHNLKEQYKEAMKQKPVAWRNLCVSNIGEDSEWIYNEIGQGEPLYTAPRELSDEEIGQIWKDCMESPYMQVNNPIGFARSILKKASEK